MKKFVYLILILTISGCCKAQLPLPDQEGYSDSLMNIIVDSVVQATEDSMTVVCLMEKFEQASYFNFKVDSVEQVSDANRDSLLELREYFSINYMYFTANSDTSCITINNPLGYNTVVITRGDSTYFYRHNYDVGYWITFLLNNIEIQTFGVIDSVNYYKTDKLFIKNEW